MGRGDSYQLQGQEGGVVLSPGNQTGTTRTIRWVQVAQDTILDNLSSNLENGGDLTNITLPAGFGFGGVITSIGVASGMVICYYA